VTADEMKRLIAANHRVGVDDVQVDLVVLGVKLALKSFTS